MPALSRTAVCLFARFVVAGMSANGVSLQADERAAAPRFAVREEGASPNLIAVYLVADEHSKSRSSIPLRIPGKEEVTIEVDAEPILLPQHFSRLEVEPVFPDKYTVSAGLNRVGASRYSVVAENHIGREYAWVVDGVARTKSILRYPAPAPDMEWTSMKTRSKVKGCRRSSKRPWRSEQQNPSAIR